MTLQPGTRVPMAMGYSYERGYYRGLLEGLTLGSTVGIILGAMCCALAWSHLGG